MALCPAVEKLAAGRFSRCRVTADRCLFLGGFPRD